MKLLPLPSPIDAFRNAGEFIRSCKTLIAFSWHPHERRSQIAVSTNSIVAAAREARLPQEEDEFDTDDDVLKRENLDDSVDDTSLSRRSATSSHTATAVLDTIPDEEENEEFLLGWRTMPTTEAHALDARTAVEPSGGLS